MSIYDDLRIVASDLLGEFSQGVIQYVTLTPQAGDTPDEPLPPSTSAVTIAAVARPVSTKYVDGSLIVQSDKQITVPGSLAIDSTGYFTIDGVTYKIIQTFPRPAAGTPVTIDVVVRA